MFNAKAETQLWEKKGQTKDEVEEEDRSHDAGKKD